VSALHIWLVTPGDAGLAPSAKHPILHPMQTLPPNSLTGSPPKGWTSPAPAGYCVDRAECPRAAADSPPRGRWQGPVRLFLPTLRLILAEGDHDADAHALFHRQGTGRPDIQTQSSTTCDRDEPPHRIETRPATPRRPANGGQTREPPQLLLTTRGKASGWLTPTRTAATQCSKGSTRR